MGGFGSASQKWGRGACLSGLEVARKEETIQDGSGLHREKWESGSGGNQGSGGTIRVLFEACELLRGGEMLGVH